MKKISILGSTGSIGKQTLEIVRHENEFEVVALAAGSNYIELEKQIREFSPRIAVMWDEKAALELRTRVADLPVQIFTGMDGLFRVATISEAEVVVNAMVGMIGIRPTIAAIEAGKNIALANKETLVTAGHLIMPLVRQKGVTLLPIDSEHSAIFQCLQGESRDKLKKILLTASGGPFRGKSKEDLEKVTKEDALRHPNWNMGPKITIDSATLVNKGLEVLEASWLFDVDLSAIEVVIHPQSIIHSMVEYKDGAVIAQLGLPDMRLPIAYALRYPRRKPLPTEEHLDFRALNSLTFAQPDTDTFYALPLAYEAGRIGGSMPTVYNAANEQAVRLFLDDKIHFTQISALIRESMRAFDGDHLIMQPCVEEILHTQEAVENFVKEVAL
ncbi:MAG: 1-deoxy-D-xylulose-5-phosphate reductoisomerase [Clostridium sp.]|jgi:1-deoxy-D-xylulose-5-phosphate reductoisomerase|nr:1-deoxy-D-xylulose-5-phosphate reductoisomerase [Clostridium sp.]